MEPPTVRVHRGRVSLASTMVLPTLLIDRGELHSVQGRAMIGITLVDDLLFVVLIVLLPVLADLSGSRLLGIGLAFGKALLILVPEVQLTAKLVPPCWLASPKPAARSSTSWSSSPWDS